MTAPLINHVLSTGLITSIIFDHSIARRGGGAARRIVDVAERVLRL